MTINGTEFSRRRWFILLLLGLLLVVFLYIISDLLLGVIGGALLAGMTNPIHRRLLRATGNRKSTAALMALAVTTLCVIVPLSLIILILVSDASRLAGEARAWFEPHRPVFDATIAEITSGGSLYFFDYEIPVTELTTRLEESAGKISEFLIGLVQKTAGTVARGFLLLAITMYSLFFFYRDGDKFYDWLKSALPLSPDQSERLLSDFFATSRASLKSVGIIGAIQGALGGLAFWFCGIPAPIFWAILMTVASVIPAIGAQIILLPAGILLILVGKTAYGAGLLLWSWIVIANIDQLLRPYLVRRDVDLHELLVFLTTIGGLATFGFFGFLIGPVIAALLKSTFQIYHEVNVSS